MLHITFKYKDWRSKGQWNVQQCTVESINEFIRIYELDDDNVDWELISVEDDDKCEIQID